jgi:Zn-dependent peptidase ImmA (M78 family)
MEQEFEKGLSGFAYQKSGNRFIGINSSEIGRRKRFTIAHELGHLFLHKQDAVNYDPAIMYFRDTHSSEGTDTKEIEANAFAAELLMPEDEVRKLIVERGGLDMEDTSAIEELANRFDVSHLAMTIRLTNLYFSTSRL